MQDGAHAPITSARSRPRFGRFRATGDRRSGAAHALTHACADRFDAFAAAWDKSNAVDLARLAAEQRVDGLLVRAARRVGVWDGALDGAQARTRAASLHHLAVLGSLRSFSAATQRAGFDTLVLKGPVLQELAWKTIPRPYTDLDVLVARDVLADCLGAVEHTGGEVVDRNWSKLDRERLGEVHCVVPHDTPLDVHWHLVNQQATRRKFRIAAADLFERSRTVDLAGAPSRALGIEDGLLHLALHAAISGGHRLVWLVDLRLAIAADPVDWDTLVARARAWRVGLPVAAMLARAQRTVDAAVPPELVDRLTTRAQRPLVRMLAPWHPTGRLPGGGSVGGALARSLRDGLPATGVATAGATGAMLRRFVDHHEYWLDPDDHRNVLFPTGGPGGRSEYVRRIQATDAYGHATRPPRGGSGRMTHA